MELLLDDAGRAAGALVLDIRRGTFVAVRARATLLAMGGGPTMYRVIACSADKSADGIALGYRAGLALRDMEMVQFHPTGLVIPGSLMTGALLEEGLRGAGGYLRNGQGERFMARYDAARMERSTRDLVSRASFLEVTEGRGTPNGGVWIDVSHLGAETVERNFRGMVRRCRDFGRDLARGPVEVGPTAHFLMGGVVIDPACRTSIEGLFAAGEDTGGVHGANRLGGNGVAESTVFGGLAGDVMAAFVEGRPRPARGRVRADAARRRAHGAVHARGRPGLYDLQRDLRDVMWERAGLVRDAEGLGAAGAEIERIDGSLDLVGVAGDPSLNTAWQDWLNLKSQATGGPADRAVGARAAREPGRALATRFSRAGGDTALHGARAAGGRRPPRVDGARRLQPGHSGRDCRAGDGRDRGLRPSACCTRRRSIDSMPDRRHPRRPVAARYGARARAPRARSAHRAAAPDPRGDGEGSRRLRLAPHR